MRNLRTRLLPRASRLQGAFLNSLTVLQQVRSRTLTFASARQGCHTRRSRPHFFVCRQTLSSGSGSSTF